ncbi:MAG: alternative ribosome rescue aminoacyl-tRNA hydrolase ArfB [Candidatus Thiodiazotropha sp.]
MSLVISAQLAIPDSEIQFNAIRAQGAGGQNVNKVSSAIHLRFDIQASSLPDHYKQRLMQISDKRISGDGVVIIKAQRYRDQEKNRLDALQRLKSLIQKAVIRKKRRIPTKPSKSSKKRRLDDKSRRGKQKVLRSKVID